jgi:hypothetical protein
LILAGVLFPGCGDSTNPDASGPEANETAKTTAAKMPPPPGLDKSKPAK